MRMFSIWSATILQQGSLCRISLDYEIHSNHIEDLLDMVHGSFKTYILLFARKTHLQRTIFYFRL